MNRAEFLKLMRGLLDEMEADHEEHTGITGNTQMSLTEWQDEIAALYENTR